MRVSQAQQLPAMFRRLEGLDWTNPERCLKVATVELRKQPDLLEAVSRYLNSLSPHALADLATRAFDGPTRFDLVLHRPPGSPFECTLHVSRRSFADSVTAQPWMNRKGYWLLTAVLRGQLSIVNYRYNGFGDPVEFPDTRLDRESEQLYGPGQSFMLDPLQIHQLASIDKGTVTLSIRPTASEGPMRVYHRNMHYITSEDLVPMPRRLLDLARSLSPSSTPS